MRLLGLGAFMASLYFCNSYSPYIVKQFAENKVAEFMNCRQEARIGKITGGIFDNIVFHDINVKTKNFASLRDTGDPAALTLNFERIELSCSLWDFIREKISFFSKDKNFFYVKTRFSRDNPFINGEMAIYVCPGSVAVKGRVKPLIFGERETEIKGLFLKLDNYGKFRGCFLYGKKWKMDGVIDFPNRRADIDLIPFSEKTRVIKIRANIDNKEKVEIYARMDKLKTVGIEIIGDLKVVCKNFRVPEFSVKAENLIINKQPFWDCSINGHISPQEKTIFFDKAQWGEGITLSGKVKSDDGYPADIRLSAKGVRIEDLAGILGEKKGLISGIAEADAHISGPIKKSSVKGRIYVGDGNLGSMKFRSVFAGFEGVFPVIRIIDSRVVKSAGQIKISGEIDFSRITDNRIFEKVIFETDNKVAVWDDWQISKEKEPRLAEMKRERVTLLTTAVTDDALQEKSGAEVPLQADVGVKYKIDALRSIKLEFEEEKDFVGIEHRIEF